MLRWLSGAACGVCTGRGFNEGSLFTRENEICLPKAGSNLNWKQAADFVELITGVLHLGVDWKGFPEICV